MIIIFCFVRREDIVISSEVFIHVFKSSFYQLINEMIIKLISFYQVINLFLLFKIIYFKSEKTFFYNISQFFFE